MASPKITAMAFQMWLCMLLAMPVVALDEDQCHLQLRRAPGSLVPLELPSELNTSFDDMQKLWTTPGHFPQCPSAKFRRGERLLQTQNFFSKLSDLPDKIKCEPGEVPIGNFQGDSYNFSCCAAGAQCGGCRRSEKGVCLECAAGYVNQSIPVMDISRCFVCDDVPNWKDSMSRTCSDYVSEGLCTGSWPDSKIDLPYHGLRPSEACCACGGGSVQPTQVQMRLAASSVYVGQAILAFPEPVAEAVQVNTECNLAELGLDIAATGEINGTVSLDANKTSSELKCSVVLTQDPVRGIFSSINLEVPVSSFSYGEEVLMFKFWGLDATAAVSSLPVKKAPTMELRNYQLKCVPDCRWLELDPTDGSLSIQPNLQIRPKFPSELKGSVDAYEGMASCSCQTSAESVNGTHSTDFVALQARLWRSGAYSNETIIARMGAEIEDVKLLEDPGPGLIWYTGPGNDVNLALPVLQNVSTGEQFVVAPSISPMILDVNCRDDMNNLYGWSRITGDVALHGQVAFNLNPQTGDVSGIPALDLSNTQGRASVVINCQVALGGPAYDKVLPVVNVAVKILDDVCWVPSNVSQALWQNILAKNQASCLSHCRMRDDCAAAHWSGWGSCYIMVGSGRALLLEPALVRLNNCSEDFTSVNLSVPGAWYVQGQFSPSNSYKHQESYSRAGSTPERQLNLVQGAFVQSQQCDNAKWLLLHMNSTDYKDGDTNAPEYFGAEMACIYEDVLSAAFQDGEIDFELDFLPTELSNAALVDTPSAKQSANLKLSVPSCAKPELDANQFILGTPEDVSFYSLHPCECFGQAHSQVAPVDESSNDAVPRNSGSFNNGSLPDQVIFTGPFTCEKNARIEEVRSTTLESCAKGCRGNSSCQFYQFQTTSGECVLFNHCDYLQRIDVPVENTLYGIPPQEGSFCRIADAQLCWQQIKRRSLLSFVASDLPSCLFQTQFEQCDTLQMISGQATGQCSRCEYLNSSTSYALQGMKKLPPPDEFPAASQVSIGCNDTSRMFAKYSGGLGYDGPRPSVTFTCVSGEWVGEPGTPWQFLSNLSCEECLQVGSASWQELSSVSMPEVYFLEHREIHVTHGTANPGCAFTGSLTPAHLLLTDSGFYLAVSPDDGSSLTISTTASELWFLDQQNRLRIVDAGSNTTCVCACEADETCGLRRGPCNNNSWTLIQQVLMDPGGVSCASLAENKVTSWLTVKPCGADVSTWYFQSGECFVGFDMVDTAAKTWNVTVTTETKVLELKELEFEPEVTNRTTNLFQIRLDQETCIEADWNCNWTGSTGSSPSTTNYCMKVSDTCTGAFGFEAGDKLRYYPNGDLRLGPFYLWAGCPPDWSSCMFSQGLLFVVGSEVDAFEWVLGSNYIKQKGEEYQIVAQGEGVSMTPFPRETLSYPCAPALMSVIAGPIYKGPDGHDTNDDFQECGNTAPLSFYTGDCESKTYHYKKDEKHFYIGCDSDQVLEWVSGHFASEGYYTAESGNIEYRCCSLLLPSRTWSTYVFEGSVTAKDGHKGDYIFTCEGTAWPGPGLLQGFTWAQDSDDADVNGCLAFVRCNVGSSVGLQDCQPQPWNSNPCEEMWSDYDFPAYRGQNQSANTETLVSSCEASVSIVASENSGDAEGLHLAIQNEKMLTPEQLMAYSSVPTMQVQVDSETLFSCRSSPGGPVLVDKVNTTLCANRVPISGGDLERVSGVVSNSGDQSLLIQKTCPVLMRPSEEPQNARVVSAKGMSMDSYFNILKNQVYMGVPFTSPRDAPFYFSGPSLTSAQLVGFLSLSPVGQAFWGLKCPPGAVVASQELMLPYCLQIGASETEEVFTSFSGSASCPLGSAISGWYNLPAVPVASGDLGGPQNFTGLQLYCRKTSLLSFCAQPQHSQCSKGNIVASVSYSSNDFKVGCCQLQSRLGFQLTARSVVGRGFQDFEGYYCPTQIDLTGAAIYNKTSISALGNPGSSGRNASWTLSWDNFRGAWQLRVNDVLRASIQSGEVLPVDINSSSALFSATFIRPLTCSYLVKPKVKSPFPQKKPTYPKLVEFHATQPDYKAYCDPMVLQSPGAFKVSVDETNPCYHTFNAELVKGVSEMKGISEQTFWDCADRAAARKYMGSMVSSGKQKAKYDLQKTIDLMQDISLALQLAAGVAGMIPWGSYAAPGEKGAEKGSKVAEKEEEKVAEKEIKVQSEREIREEGERAQQEIEERQKKQFLDAVVARQKLNEEKKAAEAFAKQQQRSESVMGVIGQYYTKHSGQMSSFISTLGTTTAILAKLQTVQAKPSKKGSQKNVTKAMQEKTMPSMDGPDYKQTSAMATADWNDCLPLQFGLSKVMCDLFCIQDSVREGTSAILSSLEDSQRVLMKNLQALLNYQTQYILWAIGTVINQKPTSDAPSEIPSASGLLEELRHIDFEDARATVPSISREVLDWHQSTAPELYDRMATMTVNATAVNWPYRVRMMRSMLQHFQAQFRDRIYRKAKDRLIEDKLQLLRRDAAQHRHQAEQAQLLRFQMSSSRTWTSLLDSFLHCHEKHSTFTMMQLRALDQHDRALSLAQNFSQCKADTASLRETWQRAMRAEERSKEALLEAWSATVTTAERLAVAFEDEDFLMGVADLEHGRLFTSHLRDSCHSMPQLVQKLYVEAVARIDRTLRPLSMQLIIFNALAKYQEQQLLHQRLDYIPLPKFTLPKEQLVAMADPAGHGMHLTIQVLEAMGRELCPAPPSCSQGMLLHDISLAIQQMDEVEPCRSTKVGMGAAFVGAMTYNLAEALMQNVTLEPASLSSLSLLELADL